MLQGVCVFRASNTPLTAQGPAKEGELGVGPIRVWAPGGGPGLSMSRSIGDIEMGPGLLSDPNIKQASNVPAHQPHLSLSLTQ